MRLLIVGINFAPELTGVGKYTGEMAEWLAARGHEVRVVTAPPYYPEWRVREGYRANRYARERWRGTRVYRCPVWVPTRPGGVKRLFHLASFALSSLAVVLSQVTWRPNVVWVAEPALFCAPSAWLAARLCGARAWLHIQDYEVDAAFETGLLKGAVLRRALTTWEGCMMQRFDRVSTISRRMLDRAEARGVSTQRLVLFPNWANVDPVARRQRVDLLRSKLGIAPEAAVLLYSGTMGRKQGLEDLGRAAAALRDTTDLVFVFCGSGPTRTALEAQCHGLPNVRFLDLQPAEHLGALLSMADIHLLPQEAGIADLVMPSKITGMLASGRPVVATCAEGTELAQVVRDRGLIVPAGDFHALAAVVRKLAADKELRTRLGDNARAYALEHLSRDIILTRFEKELKELITDKMR